MDRCYDEVVLSILYIVEGFSISLQLDGRVKTLHPNIHGGILARRDQKHHMEALIKHGIGELYYLSVISKAS